MVDHSESPRYHRATDSPEYKNADTEDDSEDDSHENSVIHSANLDNPKYNSLDKISIQENQNTLTKN